jgi:predicted O-linked N-acetylglucosamine transferase (SPINDLY family)
LLGAGSEAARYHRLGDALREEGKLDEAAKCYRQAAALEQQPGEAHLKAGNCLLLLDRAVEAAVCCSAALAARPNFPEAANSLGFALQKMGRLEQAIVCYRKAIALNPKYADAYANLSLPLQETGHIDEAIASCQEAIRLDPRSYAAYSQLSVALTAAGKLEEATQSARKAISINPNHAAPHLNLGNALHHLGLLSQAVECFRRAIELDPEDCRAYSNLGESLRDLGRIAEAAESYKSALAVRPDFAVAYSNLLYLYAYTRAIPPEEELALASKWEEAMLSEEERAAARRRASPLSGAFAATPRAGRRLHLGVVSAELGTHAVAEFLQPLLETMGKERLRLTLFPTTVRKGDRAGQLCALADGVVSLVGMSAGKAAERIRAEAVDVLMDTTGHTCNCRLDIFAHRAAPVQLSYIGYWSTTGLTEMDWMLADMNTPAFIDRHFRERLWRLPRVAQCYRGDPSLPESRWQPGETVWLGSFNKYSKMREETFALWGKVMTALPEARLLLEDRTEHEEEAHERVLAGMAKHGVTAGRIEFHKPIYGHMQHMTLYDRLDIALDTIPFNSGTTAYDALWMGVPLVSLEGNYNGGMISSTALRDIGREEWISYSEEEYVTIICALARNVELRKQLRKTQRARIAASPVCDYRALAMDIQTALEQMYDLWLASESR